METATQWPRCDEINFARGGREVTTALYAIAMGDAYKLQQKSVL